MNPQSPKDGSDLAPTTTSIHLVLKGYVPLSQNKLRGLHWSKLHREKQRAMNALKYALSCMRYDPVTGTTTSPNPYKIAVEKLVLFPMTTGEHCKGESSQGRPEPEQKSEPK